MSVLWHDYLYQPVFNGLIWIYNNWTDQNMGWAIVYLTVLLRTALLPFTLVNEFAEIKNTELSKDVARINKELANDPILKNEEIRRVLKKRKVHPWAKVVVIGIQLVVLILLYQVFLRGITGEKILDILYSSVEFPGKINTMFFGFDLGQTHDLFWSGLVGIFLMAEIYIGFRTRKGVLEKGDLAYFILFPVAVFIPLFVLPMVKSLFVLTSIVYSALIHVIIQLFFHSNKKEEEASTAPPKA